MTHRRKGRSPVPRELEQALDDVAAGKALLMFPPAPEDKYGNYQYQQAMKALTPKENPMPEPTAPYMAYTDKQVESLAKSLDILLTEHQRQITELKAEIDELRSALSAGGVQVDVLNESIVSFLTQHPGLKMSAVSVAENIVADPQKVADRLRTLARKGRVKVIDRENRHPLYFAEVK